MCCHRANVNNFREACNMQTSVTFKNFEPSEHLKTFVQDKLDRFDRFLDNPAEANVVLSVEKFRHIAEINVNGDRKSQPHLHSAAVDTQRRINKFCQFGKFDDGVKPFRHLAPG